MSDRTVVTLRPATRDDAADLLAWRNDPITRGNSRNTAEVTPAEHAAWLDRVLADPNRRLWVGMVHRVPVGTSSATRGVDGAVEIAVTVAPDARGRGLAAKLVSGAVEQARSVWRAARIRAEIKPDNVPSRRAFERCGFVLIADAGDLLDYELGVEPGDVAS
jgi:RimJ/RimL family protein N-acetyltransferase